MGGSLSPLGLLCLALSTACCATEPARPPAAQPPLQPVTRRVYLMGTQAELTVYAESPALGRARIEAFLRVLEEAEAELSSWRQDSLISRLNRHPIGVDFPLQPRICRLFGEVFDWSRRSMGAFDPAVEPLVAAWGIRGQGRLPASSELAAALARSGLSRFRFEPDRCRIARLADTGVDTGAFGKGAALDWVRETSEASTGPWLIDLGGQIAVGAAPPGRGGWEVGLASPRARDRAVFELDVDSGGLATSGGSERDLEANGQRVGHILDPRDGRPAAYRGSVTVWHPSALTADILSTALYVMGPEKGLPWADSQGVAALYLPDSGAPLATRDFRARFPGVGGGR